MTVKEQIVIEQLDKIFSSAKGERQVQALDRLSLKIPEGQFFSELGPSGCGKSTLLRIVGGLIEPTSGTISMGNGAGPANAARRACDEYGFSLKIHGCIVLLVY